MSDSLLYQQQWHGTEIRWEENSYSFFIGKFPYNQTFKIQYCKYCKANYHLTFTGWVFFYSRTTFRDWVEHLNWLATRQNQMKILPDSKTYVTSYFCSKKILQASCIKQPNNLSHASSRFIYAPISNWTFLIKFYAYSFFF